MSVCKRPDMLLFGHPYFNAKPFYHISSIEAIENTPSNSKLFIEFDPINLDIIQFSHANSLLFALRVESIKEIIFASALGASYIVVPKELAKSAQNIANEYLFDAKILALIDDEDDIEELAILGVDGVIFSEAIIKINS